ncbi:hypothetical protein [Owenweeksia hongkongensis]|uniref:hypothetical protein n=1 Tax=Owenweeksia hongkongensis TaxID=253245 RepID=UPI003A945C5D
MKTKNKIYVQKTATIANLIGLAIPFLWITIYVLQQAGFPKGLYWYEDVEYPISIIVGCITMLASSYILAGSVYERSIKTKTMFILASIGAALLSLIIGSFIGSVVFFLEYHTAIDYEVSMNLILKFIGIPILFFVITGAIPAGIIGGISGWLTYTSNKTQDF